MSQEHVHTKVCIGLELWMRYRRLHHTSAERNKKIINNMPWGTFDQPANNGSHVENIRLFVIRFLPSSSKWFCYLKKKEPQWYASLCLRRSIKFPYLPPTQFFKLTFKIGTLRHLLQTTFFYLSTKLSSISVPVLLPCVYSNLAKLEYMSKCLYMSIYIYLCCLCFCY